MSFGANLTSYIQHFSEGTSTPVPEETTFSNSGWQVLKNDSSALDIDDLFTHRGEKLGEIGSLNDNEIKLLLNEDLKLTALWNEMHPQEKRSSFFDFSHSLTKEIQKNPTPENIEKLKNQYKSLIGPNELDELIDSVIAEEIVGEVKRFFLSQTSSTPTEKDLSDLKVFYRKQPSLMKHLGRKFGIDTANKHEDEALTEFYKQAAYKLYTVEPNTTLFGKPGQHIEDKEFEELLPTDESGFEALVIDLLIEHLESALPHHFPNTEFSEDKIRNEATYYLDLVNKEREASVDEAVLLIRQGSSPREPEAFNVNFRISLSNKVRQVVRESMEEDSMHGELTSDYFDYLRNELLHYYSDPNLRPLLNQYISTAIDANLIKFISEGVAEKINTYLNEPGNSVEEFEEEKKLEEIAMEYTKKQGNLFQEAPSDIIQKTCTIAYSKQRNEKIADFRARLRGAFHMPSWEKIVDNPTTLEKAIQKGASSLKRDNPWVKDDEIATMVQSEFKHQLIEATIFNLPDEYETPEDLAGYIPDRIRAILTPQEVEFMIRKLVHP